MDSVAVCGRGAEGVWLHRVVLSSREVFFVHIGKHLCSPPRLGIQSMMEEVIDPLAQHIFVLVIITNMSQLQSHSHYVHRVVLSFFFRTEQQCRPYVT